MIACIQRVTEAQVEVEGDICGKIGLGMLILVGVAAEDDELDVQLLAEKVVGLRIFEDSDGKTNLSLADVQGEILCISQFTLLADCRKGRRPSFTQAADPEKGNEYYQTFVEKLKNRGANVQTGIFQTDMKVSLVNQGPFTIVLNSQRLREKRG